jgi:hypothetical protein
MSDDSDESTEQPDSNQLLPRQRDPGLWSLQVPTSLAREEWTAGSLRRIQEEIDIRSPILEVISQQPLSPISSRSKRSASVTPVSGARTTTGASFPPSPADSRRFVPQVELDSPLIRSLQPEVGPTRKAGTSTPESGLQRASRNERKHEWRSSNPKGDITGQAT